MIRTALVTGCSSGIGLAIARDLLDAGWSVTGLSRSKPDLPGLSHVAVDLTDAEALNRVMADLAPPDALIHAAGLLRVGPHDSLSSADGAAMWRLHVDVAAQLISHFAPRMEDRSRIVLLGSRVASGAVGKALYAASKAGVIGLARSVAAELAPRGITVNIVAPAATNTPMLNDPGRKATPPKMPPMGRLIEPEEIAGTVRFLLSEAAASITGQQLVICGGASL